MKGGEIMPNYTHIWQCKNCGYRIKTVNYQQNPNMPHVPKNCKGHPTIQKNAPHIMEKVQ